MQALVSYDKAPPVAVPLRFFLSGPLFAVLAGFLLLFAGPAVLASRWTPAALAATHLITLGFMSQVMAGALMQILPVMAGANVARPLLVSRLVHAGLVGGALSLPAAFLLGMPGMFVAAAVLLGGALAVFIFAIGHALLGVPSTSPTIRGLKLALFGLAGVVVLGTTLALALAKGWALPLPLLTNLHAGWGLGAWAGVLLVAIAYVVVPMFQLTPGYPARPSWWFPPLTTLLLLLWTLAVGLGSEGLIRLAEASLAVAGIVFAIFTLHLQRRGRRARADATYRYWQSGLVCTLAAMLMLLLAAAWPQATEWSGWAPLFGVVFGVGGFMAFIIGMLYKIVPFLVWLHLQNAGKGKVMAPNMSKILPEKQTKWQMLAHFAALFLLIAAVLAPEWLARPAGLAVMLAYGWLAFNLFAAIRVYRSHIAQISQKLSG